MKLYAISDLHLANKPNKEALLKISDYKSDYLILAGDIAEKTEDLRFALSILTQKFKQVFWVPGNHDLWTFSFVENELKGEEKYFQMVDICREYNVLTPEDEFLYLNIDGIKCAIAPTFTLYDYSFRPDDIPHDKALIWAEESGVICTDESLLFSHPYASVTEWCKERCKYSEKRLAEIPSDIPIIYVNHYPILKDHAKVYRFPRFTLWCGTKLTKNWIKQFNIKVVIYGHLHIRQSRNIDGIIFEEVSFGYPRDWNSEKGIDYYLREISLT